MKNNQEKAQEKVKLAAVVKNFDGLRDALFDEINLLRSQEINVSHARAMSLLAKQIIDASALEMSVLGRLNPTKEIRGLNG